MNLFNKLAGLFAVVAALFLLAGCKTTDTGGGTGTRKPREVLFKKGELVVVMFSGVDSQIQPHEERIREDGTITLSLIGAVKADGKTSGQLQQDIRTQYVTNKFYNETLNVTVKAPDRFFFVGGEVRAANRYQWVEGMTIIKAVQNAGYFTEYAKRSKVRVTGEDGETTTVNFDKALENPRLDVPIYPYDSITVPKKKW